MEVESKPLRSLTNMWRHSYRVVSDEVGMKLKIGLLAVGRMKKVQTVETAQRKGWENEEGTGRETGLYLPVSMREQQDVTEVISEMWTQDKGNRFGEEKI